MFLSAGERAKQKGCPDLIRKWCQGVCNRSGRSDGLEDQATELLINRAGEIGTVYDLVTDLSARQHAESGKHVQFPMDRSDSGTRQADDLPHVKLLVRPTHQQPEHGPARPAEQYRSKLLGPDCYHNRNNRYHLYNNLASRFARAMAKACGPRAVHGTGMRVTMAWEPAVPNTSPYERQLIEAALSSRGNEIDAGTALVMLPDLPDFRRIGDGAIWPALQAAGFRPLRGDPAFHSGSWVGDVARWLRSAELIVADLTARNPDVLYALGLAHGLGRCPILIAQSPDELPFHLQTLRCIRYEPTTAGLWEMREELARAVRVFLAAAEASRAGEAPKA